MGENIRKNDRYYRGENMIKNNNKYNVAFLILHYYTIEDTKKLVESIVKNCKKNEFGNYEIVIVDNGSKNQTGKELEDMYAENEKIEVIINEENLGFSAGNNVGFNYIKDNYKVDFIIMMNNDIVMVQDDFISLIFEEYEKSYFAILGPKILLPENSNDPHRNKLQPIYIYQFEIFKLYVKWLINFLDKKEILRNIKNKFFDGKKHKTSNINQEVVEEKRLENVIIHGSCIIFSREYIRRFDGLDEKTFLYGEEDLLYIKVIRNNLISIYNPKLYVFHNEDSSTNIVTKNNRRNKILFTCKYGIIARKVIIKELRKVLKERGK